MPEVKYETEPTGRMFQLLIRKDIEAAIQEEAERLLYDAHERLKTKVIQKVAEISIRLLSQVSMETQGQTLLIRVDMSGKE